MCCCSVVKSTTSNVRQTLITILASPLHTKEPCLLLIHFVPVKWLVIIGHVNRSFYLLTHHFHCFTHFGHCRFFTGHFLMSSNEHRPNTQSWKVSIKIEVIKLWISHELMHAGQKLTRRPVSDVAGDVHDGVLSSVARRSQSAAVTGSQWVRRRRHLVDGNVTETHSDDETSTRPHAQPHVSCQQ